MIKNFSKLFRPIAIATVTTFALVSASHADKFTFHGASQFDEKHAFRLIVPDEGTPLLLAGTNGPPL